MTASLDLPLGGAQRPAGHTAVMAGRAATAPDDLDYFPTPPWAGRAGGELIRALDPAARTCWEPACGEGHLAWGLKDYFEGGVFASDVHEYTPGQRVIDFLTTDLGAWPMAPVDWIVTNPPFIHGEAFVRTAMRRARVGVAMLLRLVFLEGAKRHRLLYVDHPLTVAAPFAERVPMVKGRWDPEASSATAYAWFLWLKPAGRVDEGRGGPRLVPVPPGTRARLSKPEDLVRWGHQPDAPLLGPGG